MHFIHQVILDSAARMRGRRETIRRAELPLLRKVNKGKKGEAI